MNRLSSSTIRKVCYSVILLGGLMLVQLPMLAQAQDAQKYTVEEYDAYQAIAAATDPGKKVDLVVKFFKTWPKSTLKPNVLGEYQKVMHDLQAKKDWSQIIAYGRKVTGVVSDSYTLSLLTAAYQATGNDKQFVAFGEEVYAKSPSGNLAYYLAKSYQKLGNPAKFTVWAERAVKSMPDNHEMLLELTRTYSGANRTAEAEKYANQCLKALADSGKPEQMSQGDWNKYSANAKATCYYVIGYGAYTRQQFTAAEKNLESSLQYYPRNQMAFYYLGQSYWQTQRLDLAMINFAKAYLMGGTAAQSAKQNLDNLYRSTHQQSLVGLDRVIAKAKAELK